MTEADLSKKIKKLLSKHDILWQRIESGSTGLGIPDVFYQTEHSQGWIELKCKLRKIGPETYEVPFRSGQYNWLRNYSKRGGNAFLFLHQGTLLYIFKNKQIKCSYTTGELMTINKFAGRQWNQHRLYRILDF